MSQGQTNKALKKKKAMFVTKFNKSSKNGPHQKKSIIWGKIKDKNLFHMSFYDPFFFAEMAFQSNQLDTLCFLNTVEVLKCNYNNGLFASFASW